jgi:hypothetical protein
MGKSIRSEKHKVNHAAYAQSREAFSTFLVSWIGYGLADCYASPPGVFIWEGMEGVLGEHAPQRCITHKG